MAAVYEARDNRRGISCAIKEMSLSTVPENEQAQAIQNFSAEARILSRLNHPNLPAFTDFFTEGTRHFLVMEYIDGSTLEELLEANHGPFSERRVLGWARQLCDVLEYLHSQQPPVIFRDLKPGNIMLTRAGHIKLIDFGIARLFRFSSSQDTQLLGTPGFAPPEQYGKSQTDERSDIYSLAMTLFQLMTDSMTDQGFSLKDVHATHPKISPPVARALEKATMLKPEERYESVVIFRRALLGIGTFRFENGNEATTPDELADLCSHYPEEAADYLFAGEIESWLQEIGENELARVAKRIRATTGAPEIAVDKLLQAILGPAARTHGSTSTQSTVSRSTGSYPGGNAASQGSRPGREPALIVEPRTIDFGQVYPGLCAPILLTIAGAKGALISGTIHAVEPWIVVDKTTFDGARTPVNVRVDSTRLRGSTHYTGTIMIALDESEREVAVTIEVDVLGYTTTTIARQQAAQSASTQSADTVVPGAGKMRMAPQATVTVDQPLNTSRATEYQAKYGPPGSGAWNPLQQVSSRQLARMTLSLTFLAAFTTASFLYLFLANIPLLAHVSLLPPSPWFTVILVGLVPFATLGVAIANWLTTWNTKETLNRMCTSLSTSLVLLGLCEAGWQNLFGPSAPELHLFTMLLITSLAATVGSLPKVSSSLINSAIWGMTHLRWLMISLAVVIGGSLGFALTNGLAAGCFTPFGIALGIGVSVVLVLRVDRLLKQKPHP